jgi:hypothetical protein
MDRRPTVTALSAENRKWRMERVGRPKRLSWGDSYRERSHKMSRYGILDLALRCDKK